LKNLQNRVCQNKKQQPASVITHLRQKNDTLRVRKRKDEYKKVFTFSAYPAGHKNGGLLISRDFWEGATHGSSAGSLAPSLQVKNSVGQNPQKGLGLRLNRYFRLCLIRWRGQWELSRLRDFQTRCRQ
jgi:hypothetical protein